MKIPLPAFLTLGFSLTCPAFATEGLVATVAWLGSDLVSEVRRGENAGRKLGHSFVVLRWAKRTIAQRDRAATVVIELPPAEKRDAEKLALVACGAFTSCH